MDKKFFVPFETAKALKEKGYPEYADIFYDANFYDANGCFVNNFSRSDYDAPIVLPVISSPTYHEVLDWLEGKGIYITTLWNIGETDTYEIWWKCFVDITLHEEQVTSVYHTREEALNAGILTALEML